MNALQMQDLQMTKSTTSFLLKNVSSFYIYGQLDIQAPGIYAGNNIYDENYAFLLGKRCLKCLYLLELKQSCT